MLAAAAGWYVSSNAEARIQAEFLIDAEETLHQIQVRLDTYIEVVRAGAALLAADNEINGAEFRAFVARLQLRERYPGMEGIGFSQLVRRRELRSVLRALDLDGVTRLRIWPPGERPEYHTVISLEPRDSRTRAALGFDMSTDSVLLGAMARARDTGQPVMSGKLSRVPPFEEGTHASAVLYIPIYRISAPIQTLDERQRALIGFVFSPFQADDLLQHIVSATTPSVVFEVYDGAVARPSALLHRSGTMIGVPPYQSVESVQVPGRTWLVGVRSMAASGNVPQAARYTLVGGLLLSFMLFVITRAQVRAWETAARHEAELRASEAKIHALNTELEQRVIERTAQLEVANKELEAFSYSVSHDLHAPLRHIDGFSQALLKDHADQLDVEGQDYLRRVRVSAQRMAGLIDAMLALSRITRASLNREQVNLSLLAKAIVSDLRAAYPERDVEFAIHDALTANGDPQLLRIVLDNLIGNAWKFTAGQGRARIEFGALTRDGEIQYFVRDNGAGFDMAYADKLFGAFQRLHAATEFPGTGIGLATVSRIIHRHGGRVWAEGATGQGATFYFTV
jgi:signal transduction histidine kinase